MAISDDLKRLLKEFRIHINLQHMIVLGLGGYITAKLMGPQLFPDVKWTEGMYRAIAVYCGFGGSIGDVWSFGRNVKNQLKKIKQDKEADKADENRS